MHSKETIRLWISEAISTHPRSICERLQQINQIYADLTRQRIDLWLSGKKTTDSEVKELDAFMRNYETFHHTLYRIVLGTGTFYEVYAEEFSYIPLDKEYDDS